MQQERQPDTGPRMIGFVCYDRSRKAVSRIIEGEDSLLKDAEQSNW